MIDAAALLAGTTSIGELFAEQARLYPARVAIEEGTRTISYGELNRRVNRLVNHLHALGAGHGDCIAILSENRLEYVELLLACARLGCILACQNHRQSHEELTHAVGLTQARIAVVSERYYAAWHRIDYQVGSLLVLGGPYEAALASAAEHEPRCEVSPESILLVLYTSGTTGFAKGAMISHRALLARTLISVVDATAFPGASFICWAPMFHMAGSDNVVATLLLGGKIIMMDGFNASNIADVLIREPIGLLSMMPATAVKMIEALRGIPHRPKGVEVVGSMPDLLPGHLMAELTDLLQAPYRNTFGSTETGPAPASKGRIPVGANSARLSKIQSSFCQLRLVDPDDNDVPDGTPGEALVRCASLFSGYVRMPEATAEDFRGGWFHMGDVLRRNPDGTLDFVDRRKYLIKSGGENIYPAEIERLLLASEHIEEAVVVRQADLKWGEVPVAFVVPRHGELTAEQVLDLCRGRIASYKVPKSVVFVRADELPRSTIGKIKRHDLEQRLHDR
jgi:acyl-CoA synthetase (AMP-forming)/AMP-acid ligase II